MLDFAKVARDCWAQLKGVYGWFASKFFLHKALLLYIEHLYSGMRRYHTCDVSTFI